MVALASSEEEVLEQLKADIYARNEVWDFSKVCISPFVLKCRVWELKDGRVREVDWEEMGKG